MATLEFAFMFVMNVFNVLSFALANGRRGDGGEMINSFSLIEIWGSGFAVPACSSSFHVLFPQSKWLISYHRSVYRCITGTVAYR